MRLWHYKLIPYLPKSQLLAQWRELNSIFRKQDKHILINYIYDYTEEYLYNYSMFLVNEMEKRNIKIKKWSNFNKYFQMVDADCECVDFNFVEHNNEYLTICYYNLKEKYLRGQKDFDEEIWGKLDNFYKEEIKKNE